MASRREGKRAALAADFRFLDLISGHPGQGDRGENEEAAGRREAGLLLGVYKEYIFDRNLT